jgi:hypothetical protein
MSTERIELIAKHRQKVSRRAVDRGRGTRWWIAAIVVLVIAAGAAWLDARFNHDRSWVPEERRTSHQS